YVEVAEVVGRIAPSARDALDPRARPRTIPCNCPLATEAGQKTLVHPCARSLPASPAAMARGGSGLGPTPAPTNCPARDLMAHWGERRPFVARRLDRTRNYCRSLRRCG